MSEIVEGTPPSGECDWYPAGTHTAYYWLPANESDEWVLHQTICTISKCRLHPEEEEHSVEFVHSDFPTPKPDW